MVTLDQLNSIDIDDNLIFHYSHIQSSIEHVLFDGQLLFNCLKLMNDPFEFENFLYMYSAGAGSTYFTFSDLQDNSDQINAILKKTIKVCCFSIDKKGPIPNYQNLLYHRGFCRSRMWSQYGASHKGVCFVFNKKRLIDNLNFDIESMKVPIGSKVNIYWNEVIYDNRLYGLHDALLIDRDALLKGPAIDYLSRNIDKYLFLKVEDYKDEAEFRICIYSDSFSETDSIKIKYLDSLEAIILGCRFPEAYKPVIDAFTAKLSIPAFQISWYNGRPSIFLPEGSK